MKRSNWMSDAGYESGVSAEKRTVPVPSFSGETLALEVRVRHAIVGLLVVMVVTLLLAGIGYLTSPHMPTVTLDTLFTANAATGHPKSFAGFVWAGVMAVIAAGAAVFAVGVVAFVTWMASLAAFQFLGKVGRVTLYVQEQLQLRKANKAAVAHE